MGEGGVVIDLTTLTPADRNRAVVYRDDRLDYTARGRLVAWDERACFVRYWVAAGVLGWCAQATRAEDLEWED
jgi:hypothetical protein